MEEHGGMPACFPSIENAYGFALISLSSPALALMLAFRLNSTYTRWREARIAWGGVLNRSRDLARLVSNQKGFIALVLISRNFSLPDLMGMCNSSTGVDLHP